MKGWIIEAYESPDRTIYNMTLVTDDGKKHVLGGRRCILEDFEVERVTLIPKYNQ